MSSIDEAFKEAEEALRPLLKEFVTTTISEVGADAKVYGAAVAKELSKWIMANVGSDDETAKRNLRHIKAIMSNLATMHQIRLHRRTMQKLEDAANIVLRIAIVALKTTLA
jgi:hypothetical protein